MFTVERCCFTVVTVFVVEMVHVVSRSVGGHKPTDSGQRHTVHSVERYT